MQCDSSHIHNPQAAMSPGGAVHLDNAVVPGVISCFMYMTGTSTNVINVCCGLPVLGFIRTHLSHMPVIYSQSRYFGPASAAESWVNLMPPEAKSPEGWDYLPVKANLLKPVLGEDQDQVPTDKNNQLYFSTCKASIVGASSIQFHVCLLQGKGIELHWIYADEMHSIPANILPIARVTLFFEFMSDSAYQAPRYIMFAQFIFDSWVWVTTVGHSEGFRCACTCACTGVHVCVLVIADWMKWIWVWEEGWGFGEG